MQTRNLLRRAIFPIYVFLYLRLNVLLADHLSPSSKRHFNLPRHLAPASVVASETVQQGSDRPDQTAESGRSEPCRDVVEELQ